MTCGRGYAVEGWCGGGTMPGRLCCSASQRTESNARYGRTMCFSIHMSLRSLLICCHRQSKYSSCGWGLSDRKTRRAVWWVLLRLLMYPSRDPNILSSSDSFFSYSSRPTHGNADNTEYANQSRRTCGTPSSNAASTKLSSNCRREPAEITWQLTRSETKRTKYRASSHLELFRQSFNDRISNSTHSPPKL